MATLDDLLRIPTVDEIVDGEILPAARTRGLNVTAWAPLDPWRIATYIMATLRKASRTSIALRTAAGFADYVFGFATAPAGVTLTGWDRLRAKSWYGVDPIEATYTRRRITLVNSTASSYGPLAAGTLRIQSTTTGNRYIQDETATIAGSGDTEVIFRSEYPIDSASGLTYSDATGSTWVMVNASYPGVTATNPAPDYSDVAQTGPGLGTITPSGAPLAAGSHTLTLRIDSSGNANVAAGGYSYALDGGAWTSVGPLDNAVSIGGTGVDLTFDDNGGNFQAGTYYAFSWPGTDVTEVGRDAETPQELGTRCKALWPMLAFAKDASGNWIPGSPTLSAYEALARTANDQVKICYAKKDPTINDKVLIYVAGQGALLPASVISNLSAFFLAFNFATDRVSVTAPGTQAITLGGATVTTIPALAATAKAAAQTAVRNYLTGVDPANPLGVGDGSTVKVQHAYLVKLIRETVGVTALTDTALTINGAAVDLTLTSGDIATYSGDVAASLTWA